MTLASLRPSAQSPGPDRPDRGRGAPFVATTVLAGLWALYGTYWRIGFPSLASDEPTYATAAWRYVHGIRERPPMYVGRAAPANYEHPPLAKYLFGIAQLVAGHRSVVADRVVAATCTLGTAVVLGVWIGRAASRWTGLVAGLLVAVLPVPIPALDFNLGHYGLLDPVAELFMTASVAIAWVWSRRAGRAAWLWAGILGVVVGLATASKLNAVLGVVGPVLVVLFASVRTRHALIVRAAQALLAAAAGTITVLALYLPLPDPLRAVTYMLRFQLHQSAAGHVVRVAGRTFQHAPWWAFLWFAVHSLGGAVGLATVVCVGAALILRHDRLVLWCVSALAAPLVFHMLIAGVALPYYFVMWLPPYLALTAVGGAELAALWSRPTVAVSIVGAVAAVACLASMSVVSLQHTIRVARVRLTGPPYLPTVMRRNHLSGPVIGIDVHAWQLYDTRIPGGIAYRVPASLRRYDTVVISTQRCGMPTDRSVRTFLRVNLDARTLRPVYHDDKMRVYAVTVPLLMPTAQQTAAEAHRNPPSELC